MIDNVFPDGALLPWDHQKSFNNHFLGHRSRTLQWPIVITRCPASVVCRPSSVVCCLSSVCPLDNLHFQLLLQNRLIDFDETWYGWSTQAPLQVLLFFGQICPGADPGWGKNRSLGGPFFKELLFQTGRLQQQTKCIAVIYNHVGGSVVIFGFIRKSNFWRVFDVFLDLVILVYFNAISIDCYQVKSFICINFVQFPCL